jgi:hypothetical protein
MLRKDFHARARVRALIETIALAADALARDAPLSTNDDAGSPQLELRHKTGAPPDSDLPLRRLATAAAGYCGGARPSE